MNVGNDGWTANPVTERTTFAQQWTYGHVLGWTSPSSILGVLNTTEDRAFLRSMCQLKVKHSKYLVYGRLMQ